MKTSSSKFARFVDDNIGALLLLPLFSQTFSPVLSPNFVLLIIVLLMIARIIEGNLLDTLRSKNWIWRDAFVMLLGAFMAMIILYLFFSEKFSRDFRLGFWNFIIPVAFCFCVYLLAKNNAREAIERKSRIIAGIFLFTAANLALRLYFYIPVDYPLMMDAPSFDRAYNYWYNHGVISLSLMFFPVAMIVWSRAEISSRERSLIILAMLVAVSVVVMLGANHSARFAFAIGVFVLIVSSFFPRFVMTELLIFIPALVLIQPFWGQIVYYFFMDGAFENFKVTFEFRSYIWMVFGERIWDAFFFGHGIGTTELFKFGDVIRERFRDDFRGGVHSHNNFLQVCYEFGLFGALIVAALILSVLRFMSSRKGAQRNMWVGFFVSAFVIALVSHGLWQAWWMTAIGVTAVLFLMSHQLQDHAKQA